MLPAIYLLLLKRKDVAEWSTQVANYKRLFFSPAG